jgi:hypothetical protein
VLLVELNAEDLILQLVVVLIAPLIELLEELVVKIVQWLLQVAVVRLIVLHIVQQHVLVILK